MLLCTYLAERAGLDDGVAEALPYLRALDLLARYHVLDARRARPKR